MAIRKDRSEAGQAREIQTRWAGLEELEQRLLLSVTLGYTETALEGGLTGYTFVINNDDGLLLSYGATLSFWGNIQQIKAFGAVTVNTQSDANTYDANPGASYDKELDSWAFSPFANNPLPGVSLTGAAFTGFLQSTYSGSDTFEISLGSGPGSMLGNGVNLIYIVTGGSLNWSGLIARNGVSHNISGTTGDELFVAVTSKTTADPTPTLTGTVSDPEAAVTVTVDGQEYAAVVDGEGNWTVTVTNPLALGTYDVSVTATSGAETANDTTSNELVVQALSVTVNPLETADTLPVLTGTVNDAGASVTVTVNGQQYVAVVGANGQWSAAVTDALAAGTYDVSAAATLETAEGSDNSTNELRIVDLAVTVNPLSTSDTTPTLTGTVNSALATVRVTVNGQEYLASVSGGGNWSVTVTHALGLGNYDVVAVAELGVSVQDNTVGELDIVAFSEPTLVYTVTNLGNGLLGYTFKISNNDGSLSSYAITVGFRGIGGATVQQVLFSGAVIVNTETNANTYDGNGGYAKAEDSWVFNPFANNLLPGTNPFTGQVFSGIQEISGAYVMSVGSGVGSSLGDNVNVAYIVANGNIEWSGVLARSGSSYNISGQTDDIPTGLNVVVTPLTTDDTTPTITGTVNIAGATVTVTVNGVEYAAVVDGNNWSAEITNELDFDTYDVSVAATYEDLSYNDTRVGALEVVPYLWVITVDPLTTTDRTPTLTGTVNDPTATVTVTVNGVEYAAVVDGNNWTATVTNTLAPATYNVLVTAVNDLSTGTDSTTNELVIQNITLSVTVNSLTTTDRTPALSGTVNSNDATVSVTVNGVSYEATNNGNGTWSLADGTISALPLGTYDVQVTASVYGETGQDATSNELRVIGATPVLIYTVTDLGDGLYGYTFNIANGDGLSLSYGLTVGFRGVGMATIQQVVAFGSVKVNSQTNANTYNGLGNSGYSKALDSWVYSPFASNPLAGINPFTGEAFTGIQEVSGTYVMAVGSGPGSSLGDNVNVAYIVANGAVEWEGTVARNGVNYLIFGATDESEVIHVTVDPKTTNDTTPTITGLTDDTTATIEVTVVSTGATYTAINHGDGTWSAEITTPLAEGTYDLLVKATDGGGNSSEKTVVGVLVIDTTAPIITVTPVIGYDNTPDIFGTVNDPTASITVTIEGITYAAVNNGDGTWTLSGDTIAAVPSTEVSVVATATDLAGNEGVDASSDELSIRTRITLGGNAGGSTITYFDADGTKVTVSLQGGKAGLVDLIFQSDSVIQVQDNRGKYTLVSEGGVFQESIQILQDSRGLSFKTDRGGDGITEISNITGDFVLGALSGKTVDLVGDGINMAGGAISNLQLRNVFADILLGAPVTKSMAFAIEGGIDGANIVLGDFTTGSFKFNVKGSIENSSITMGAFNAKSIAFGIKGGIESSDITLGGLATGGVAFNVTGSIENANLVVNGSNVKSLAAAAMINSSLMVGVDNLTDDNLDGVYDLPQTSDLREGFEIGSVKIKGVRGSVEDFFVNSNIAADYIKSVALLNAQVDNGDEAFGLTANGLKSLTLKQGKISYKYPAQWLSAEEAVDLTVRVV